MDIVRGNVRETQLVVYVLWATSETAVTKTVRKVFVKEAVTSPRIPKYKWFVFQG